MGGIIKIEYYFFLHEDENVTKRLCLNELFKKPDLFDLTGFFFLGYLHRTHIHTLIAPVQSDILRCQSDETMKYLEDNVVLTFKTLSKTAI